MNKAEFLPTFRKLAESKGIGPDHVPEYYEVVYILAEATAQHYRNRMITVGVGGAQGSGKTSITEMIRLVLESLFSLSTEVLSIDDFYLTRDERIELSKRIHPMLAVRGVPGTHDIQRMREAIRTLGQGYSCAVPIFNKGDDDRSTRERTVLSPQVLILEGWCWGAKPCSDDELITSVNSLESEEDAECVWRQYVNQALASDEYQHCFTNDLSVFLAAPNMESVFRWRLQQESQIQTGRRIMGESEVRTFIMYYQRIAERMLTQKTADIVIQLNKDHGISAVNT